MLRQVTLMDIDSGLARTVICSHVHASVEELVGCVLCKASAPVSQHIDIVSCQALVDDRSEEFVDVPLKNIPDHCYYFVTVRAQLAMPRGMPAEDVNNNLSFNDGMKITLTSWKAKSLLEIMRKIGTELQHAIGNWRTNISITLKKNF